MARYRIYVHEWQTYGIVTQERLQEIKKRTKATWALWERAYKLEAERVRKEEDKCRKSATKR